DLPGPIEKFVRPELIRLERIPGTLQHGRTLVFWADAVLPVITGNKITTRIAHDWHAQRLDFRQHVFAVTFVVGEFRSRLVNSGIHRTAEMLEKRTEQTPIQLRSIATL